MIEKYIEELLHKKFEEPEFSDCYIVKINYNQAGKKLEVFIESDTAFTLKKSSRINKYLQFHIDEAGWLGEKYVLDVSSPGVGSPLVLHRQYQKNIGKGVEVTFLDKGRKKEEGTLLKVLEDYFVITKEVKEKIGKKKVTKQVDVEINFDEIKKTIVKISFKK